MSDDGKGAMDSLLAAVEAATATSSQQQQPQQPQPQPRTLSENDSDDDNIDTSKQRTTKVDHHSSQSKVLIPPPQPPPPPLPPTSTQRLRLSPSSEQQQQHRISKTKHSSSPSKSRPRAVQRLRDNNDNDEDEDEDENEDEDEDEDENENKDENENEDEDEDEDDIQRRTSTRVTSSRQQQFPSGSSKVPKGQLPSSSQRIMIGGIELPPPPPLPPPIPSPPTLPNNSKPDSLPSLSSMPLHSPMTRHHLSRFPFPPVPVPLPPMPLQLPPATEKGQSSTSTHLHSPSLSTLSRHHRNISNPLPHPQQRPSSHLLTSNTNTNSNCNTTNINILATPPPTKRKHPPVVGTNIAAFHHQNTSSRTNNNNDNNISSSTPITMVPGSPRVYASEQQPVTDITPHRSTPLTRLRFATGSTSTPKQVSAVQTTKQNPNQSVVDNPTGPGRERDPEQHQVSVSHSSNPTTPLPSFQNRRRQQPTPSHDDAPSQVVVPTSASSLFELLTPTANRRNTPKSTPLTIGKSNSTNTQTPKKGARVFSTQEKICLEANYDKNKFPTRGQMNAIAEGLKKPFDKVRTWFNNRRAQDRKMGNDVMRNTPNASSLTTPSSKSMKKTRTIPGSAAKNITDTPTSNVPDSTNAERQYQLLNQRRIEEEEAEEEQGDEADDHDVILPKDLNVDWSTISPGPSSRKTPSSATRRRRRHIGETPSAGPSHEIPQSPSQLHHHHHHHHQQQSRPYHTLPHHQTVPPIHSSQQHTRKFTGPSPVTAEATAKRFISSPFPGPPPPILPETPLHKLKPLTNPSAMGTASETPKQLHPHAHAVSLPPIQAANTASIGSGTPSHSNNSASASASASAASRLKPLWIRYARLRMGDVMIYGDIENDANMNHALSVKFLFGKRRIVYEWYIGGENLTKDHADTGGPFAKIEIGFESIDTLYALHGPLTSVFRISINEKPSVFIQTKESIDKFKQRAQQRQYRKVEKGSDEERLILSGMWMKLKENNVQRGAEPSIEKAPEIESSGTTKKDEGRNEDDESEIVKRGHETSKSRRKIMEEPIEMITIHEVLMKKKDAEMACEMLKTYDLLDEGVLQIATRKEFPLVKHHQQQETVGVSDHEPTVTQSTTRRRGRSLSIDNHHHDERALLIERVSRAGSSEIGDISTGATVDIARKQQALHHWDTPDRPKRGVPAYREDDIGIEKRTRVEAAHKRNAGAGKFTIAEQMPSSRKAQDDTEVEASTPFQTRSLAGRDDDGDRDQKEPATVRRELNFGHRSHHAPVHSASPARPGTVSGHARIQHVVEASDEIQARRNVTGRKRRSFEMMEEAERDLDVGDTSRRGRLRRRLSNEDEEEAKQKASGVTGDTARRDAAKGDDEGRRTVMTGIEQTKTTETLHHPSRTDQIDESGHDHELELEREHQHGKERERGYGVIRRLPR